MKKLIFTLLISTITTNLFATLKPIHLASDKRIEVVAYSPYNVVPINGTTFITTQIIFDKNEFIENVQNGDLGAWTAAINKDLPNMMFIKPTAYHSNTNMTVVTNKHTYYFHLTSNAENQPDLRTVTYAIHFTYPDEQKAQAEKQIKQQERQQHAEITTFKNPQNFNWDYSFSGDQTIMPIHIFDDGQFTYLQLQPRQPVPAVFAVTSRNGKESLVNYRQHGRYLIIQRIAPQFSLRLGEDHVASIFDNRLIKKLQTETY